MNRLVISECNDPFENLGLEEYLLNNGVDGVTMYLWQNDKTVVIGKCQNAFAECPPQKLSERGIKLARRSTGGGAVYHDLGNLNYSFIAPTGVYDTARQTAVVLKAVGSFGIRAEASGRNDLLANGKKFGGCAFLNKKDASLHHGTLLVSTDLKVMSEILSPSAEKLASNGVKSVRARVANLSEISPRITVSALKDALIRSFREEYGEYEVFSPRPREYSEYAKKYAQYEWRFGRDPKLSTEVSFRITDGSFMVRLLVKGGRIEDARVYSDCLDETFPPKAASALVGVAFDKSAVIRSLTFIGYSFGEALAQNLFS